MRQKTFCVINLSKTRVEYFFKFSRIVCNAVRKKKVALSLGAYGATMIPSAEVSGTYYIDHLGFKQLRDWDLKIPDVDGIGQAEKKKEKECLNIDTGKDSMVCTPVRHHTWIIATQSTISVATKVQKI
jgi:hypothetical protein